MKANIKWLDDPQVFRVNQSNAHSDHVCYATREEVETTSSLKQSLNGTWRFCYSPNPSVRPKTFYKPVVLVNFNILKNISKFLQNVVVLDLIEHCKPVICFQIYSLAL
ncbi:hypothetical protein SKC_00679 [Enterococcus faecium EnGen0164]|nr:hypothetical protein SKC_00679 [Enterococcus faecium EnGen0164]